MRVTELVQVMPRFFLAVIVIALFGPGLDRLVCAGPDVLAGSRARRAGRGVSIGRREFIEAARALGAAGPRILLRHVLPHALPAATVVISLNAASVILLEAGLALSAWATRGR